MCSICGRRFATPRFEVRGGQRWAHLTACPLVPISSPFPHMVYLLPLLSSYLAGCKSASVRPGYDDKYRSGSHSFVERQKQFGNSIRSHCKLQRFINNLLDDEHLQYITPIITKINKDSTDAGPGVVCQLISGWTSADMSDVSETTAIRATTIVNGTRVGWILQTEIDEHYFVSNNPTH